MIKLFKQIILPVIALILLVFLVLLFYQKPPEKQEQQKQTEIQKIQKLVQEAQETGEKEPLITISENGFSQEKIKIQANSFISFYNSTNQEIKILSKIIKPGVTSSMRFRENTEIKLDNLILKIIIK